MTKKKRIKLTKEKRNNVFRLRLTSSEREQWEAMAEAVGLGNNLSKFVRHCVESEVYQRLSHRLMSRLTGSWERLE
jgi:hypothetical protein